MKVKHGTFTPLLMSPTGGMGYKTSKFYSRLLELVSEKRETKYCVAATWMRRKIIFVLKKSISMCIKGSRSVFHREKLEQSVKVNKFLIKLSSKV